MSTPSSKPKWHQPYWTIIDRPVAGFGCLWLALVFVLSYGFLAWLIVPLRFGYW